MEIAYFAKVLPHKHDPFLNSIKNIFSGLRLFAFSDFDKFKGMLSRKQCRKPIAVIIASDEETLIDIYFARCLLRSIKSILVLPDSERHTTALAYRIGPDYTFPYNSNIDAIISTVSWLLRQDPVDNALNISGYKHTTGLPVHIDAHYKGKVANY